MKSEIGGDDVCYCHNYTNLDDKYTNSRRSAVKVYGEALQSLAELFFKERYPDDDERQKFAERVRADVENPYYRLYTISYAIRNMLLIQVIPSSDVNRIFTTIHDDESYGSV